MPVTPEPSCRFPAKLCDEAQVFRQEAPCSRPFGTLLFRYSQALLRHSERLTACNTWHPIEQRLCRWLLATHDRMQVDQFKITQEFLSQMLGVPVKASRWLRVVFRRQD